LLDDPALRHEANALAERIVAGASGSRGGRAQRAKPEGDRRALLESAYRAAERRLRNPTSR